MISLSAIQVGSFGYHYIRPSGTYKAERTAERAHGQLKCQLTVDTKTSRGRARRLGRLPLRTLTCGPGARRGSCGGKRRSRLPPREARGRCAREKRRRAKGASK